jgi:hypothetical protein
MMLRRKKTRREKSMKRKYKLIHEPERGFKRIVALRDIPAKEVKKGDKGGLIANGKQLVAQRGLLGFL